MPVCLLLLSCPFGFWLYFCPSASEIPCAKIFTFHVGVRANVSNPGIEQSIKAKPKTEGKEEEGRWRGLYLWNATRGPPGRPARGPSKSNFAKFCNSPRGYCRGKNKSKSSKQSEEEAKRWVRCDFNSYTLGLFR